MKNRFGPVKTAACALAGVIAAQLAHASTTLWWDTAYLQRFEVAVGAGANSPDKGYVDYTARVATLDTQALIAAGEMQADCSDLRMTFYDGIAWQELPRHVIGCNTTTTDIRFALVANIGAGATDDNYYLYYDNGAPAALPPLTETNVYLWYDDASIDRSASYIRGRIDSWHGSGWDNSLSWNAAGYYEYDNGDNFSSGYRRAVDERDVYIEAEFYHSGCYQLNITTGVMTRGIIASGTLGSEESDHYYASNRGEYPGGAACTSGGYSHDGDIMRAERGTIAVDGPNPGDVLANTWRRQGLATWLINPTNASFWDEDLTASWAALGFPSGANLNVNGTDATDNEGRGFAAIMTAQNDARVRNILIRRYVEPEPTLTLTAELLAPALTISKNLSTVFDPYNDATNPKAIPGGWVDYTIAASNAGPGAADNDTFVISDPLPADVDLFVGDLGGGGSGPVEFTDGVGAAWRPASGYCHRGREACRSWPG